MNPLVLRLFSTHREIYKLSIPGKIPRKISPKMELQDFQMTLPALVIIVKDYYPFGQRAKSTWQLSCQDGGGVDNNSVLQGTVWERGDVRHSPPPSSLCVSWWSSGRRWASPTQPSHRSWWAWGQAWGRGWSSATTNEKPEAEAVILQRIDSCCTEQ